MAYLRNKNQLSNFVRISSSVLLSAYGIAYSSQGLAAAFSLNEINVSGLGNAYAGRTAIAEDASTNFFNPAGLVLMNNHQIVGSVSYPLASFEMTPTSVTRATGAAMTQGKPKQDAGTSTPIPAFHVAGPLYGNFYYGFSVTAPFGLKTEYSTVATTRYFGTKSELKTIDVNPNIAYKINNQWSVGGGLSVQYAEAKLNSQLDTNLPVAAILFAGAAENINTDGKGHNTADTTSLGYNFGALFQPNNNTRLGIHFRSKIKHATEGEIKISLPPGSFGGIVPPATLGLIDQKAKATVTLPEILSFSSFQSINSDWDIMGDITLTKWSRFKKLVIKYPDTILADSRVEEKFEDAIKVAVGTNYKYTDKLTFKFGAAFDDSPVQRKHRNLRIPDSDRYWLALGAKYKVNKQFIVDAGYTHIFLKDAKVSESVLSRPLQTVNAEFKSSIDLFGIQATYNIV